MKPSSHAAWRAAAGAMPVWQAARPGSSAAAAAPGVSQVAGRPRVRVRDRAPDLLMLAPALAELVVGGYGLGGASLWRDEGDTVSAATRTVPEILRLVRHHDAVHGVYYLLIHFVVGGLGTSATAIRLPSLLATSAAAGLTACLGRRLATASGLPAPGVTGMTAGLLLVALPVTTWYAQDARPYALATLLAVAASYLLVQGWDDPRPRWWAGYGVVLVLLAAMNLLALVIVLAHGMTMALARRPPQPADGAGPGGSRKSAPGRQALLGWLAATAAAACCLAPLITLASGQSSQIAWLGRPGPRAISDLLADFSGTTSLMLVTIVLVELCVLAEAARWRRPGCRLGVVALPWLVLPPAILIAISQAHPIYDARYVLFCAPAMALLVAGGLARIARMLARPAPARNRLAAIVPVLTAAVMAAILVGPQQQVRLTSARPDDLRGVASLLAAHGRPGAAVLYVPWDASVVSLAYPAPFRSLRDIGQRESPTASATLRGLPVRGPELARRMATVTRLWVVAMGARSSRFGLAEARRIFHLQLVRSWRIRTVTLSLYLRVRPPAAGLE